MEQICHTALNSDFGIVVTVDNFEQARSAFYRARANLMKTIPAMALLSARVSPDSPHELWIVKSPTGDEANG